MRSANVLAFLFALSICATYTEAARILLSPHDHGSHVNFFTVLGTALKNAGHEVTVIAPAPFDKLPMKSNLTTIVPNVESTMDPDALMNMAAKKGEAAPNVFMLFRKVSAKAVTQIKELFAEKDFLKQLSAAKYDLVVIDGIDFHRPHYLIPYALDIPFITLNAKHDPYNSGLPSNHALEGVQISALHGDTNVFQRMLNLVLAYVFSLTSPPSPLSHITDQLFDELVPNKPNIGFRKLYKDSEMFLVNMDTICLDFHRISAPHYQFIGGLGAHETQPLPKDLEKFITASKDGFILVTFGSALKIIDEEILEKMLTVFGEMKHNVIIRHEGKIPTKIPRNVRLEPYLPQNDILGHPNTKLFVTHNGNNGQLEAVYHGVPLLMMPFFGDQFYNADRAIIHNYGVKVDPRDFTVDEFRNAVNELLTNPIYTESIKNCSAILKSLPSPQDTAIFWIEHILKFGGSHLKPYFYDMPLYKVFMVDIAVVLFISLVVTVVLVKTCCRVVCCKRRSTKSKRE